MSVTRADVIELLEIARRPLASTTVAYLLDRQACTVNAILSKLASYGKIDRQRQPGHPCRYLYSAKPLINEVAQ